MCDNALAFSTLHRLKASKSTNAKINNLNYSSQAELEL